MGTNAFRNLTADEVRKLEAQGCCAAEWKKVLVADPFDPSRVREAAFSGEVRLGRLAGTVKVGPVERACGVYSAALHNVSVGDGCLVRNVRSHLANYDLAAGAVIEDVGLCECAPGSSFGCGATVEAANEGGGRGVRLYPELSAQTAWLLATYRHRPKLVAAIERMIDVRLASLSADRGEIGAGATVRGAAVLRNVRVGPAARIEGVAELCDGTVLSEPAAPTVVGQGVTAREFVIAEGASVTGGAVLEHCYVGQGSKVGKQFSGENCLFFANCEAFLGEAVALLAGPYTVSHHKSTLLIAAQMSFYNAGSGTNQSNHMYKLGPLHQGVLERGSKTGSFSYLLWPCRVGPFSVVIGKNMANFDLGDLPFSYIDASGSRSYVTPAFNLYTVGTVRDAAKWPARDRRKATVKRDLIVFPAFSPLTVGRMLAGEALLTRLGAETPKTIDEVNVNGAWIKRLLLRSGAKYYRTGIDSYLAGRLLDRAEPELKSGLAAVRRRLAPAPAAAEGQDWADLGGLLVNRERLNKVLTAVESGALQDLAALEAQLAACHAAYAEDEWAWVDRTWQARFGKSPAELDGAGLAAVADLLLENRGKSVRMVLSDAEKEFSEGSRLGFGAGLGTAERDADFEAVRGTFEKNKFVGEMKAELAALEKRCAAFKAAAAGLR
jgi:hypothetical protein